jgi:hypothetical protein
MLYTTSSTCSSPASFFTTDDVDPWVPVEEDEPQADAPTDNTPSVRITAANRDKVRPGP